MVVNLKKMKKNNFCVIMAGGIGSRFWPLSKTSKPKQFLDILGTGKTLLQQTFERFLPICPPENIFIVSNVEYENLIKEQIPGLSDFQILLEPMRRNTAPCIAFANSRIMQVNPNANIIVTPSDHLILNEKAFIDTINQGLNFIKENDALLTLGIVPTRPETGYGYIQKKRGVIIKGNSNLRKVKTFTEKPSQELARDFIKSGEFYWNSGIFLWSYSSIHAAFERYLPDISSLFVELMNGTADLTEKEALITAYSKTKNISIDYGIMEKAENVYVYCSGFGWSDLGTWGSLYDHTQKDNEGNAKIGENIIMYDSENCIISNPENKLIVTEGLKDYVVVESEKALLICRKENEQRIKQMTNDVKIWKGEEYI